MSMGFFFPIDWMKIIRINGSHSSCSIAKVQFQIQLQSLKLKEFEGNQRIKNGFQPITFNWLSEELNNPEWVESLVEGILKEICERESKNNILFYAFTFRFTTINPSILGISSTIRKSFPHQIQQPAPISTQNQKLFIEAIVWTFFGTNTTI